MPDKGIAGARLTKLGRYEVLSELGKGAMGVVYLAKDPVIGRMVAIKTIRSSSMGEDDSESREFRERFVREAQTAGILSHPNIVTIHDIGDDAETQTSFIAMEYIEGKNLKSLLAEKAYLSYDQIADIIAQVAEAIDYAHRKGIIHRDVKPANIIITTDGKVKITDFGIAKVASSNLTSTGQFLGTPNYMSPEQVSGAPVDGRSDIFSLGVVLYELLTKRKPFLGENLTAISYKIVHEDFTPPAELSSDVPPEFNPIVARAMAKDPWNRYQRGKDFALALHQLRAHLDEQKALQDLGAIVSEAEFMPTLRLANIEELVAEGAVEARSAPPRPGVLAQEVRTEVVPPPPQTPPSLGASTSHRVSNSPAADQPSPVPSSAEDRKAESLSRATVAAVPRPPAPSSAHEIRTEILGWPASAEAGEPAKGAATDPLFRPTPQSDVFAAPVPPRPWAAQAEPPGPPAEAPFDALKRRAALAGQDLVKLLKREINPRWFWAVFGTALMLFLLVTGAIGIRASLAKRPTVPADTVLKKETDDKLRSLAEGKRLFSAGQYEQSLALFRKVLARSPSNQQARQYAQMAENAIQGREEEARKRAEAEKVMQSAQAAFAQGNYEEAKRRADEVLTLDGGRVEAQQLREEAAAKIAEAEASRKKVARAAAPTPRRAVVPPPEHRVERPAVTPTSAPSSSVSTSAMLRVLFDSPVSEGHVMVAVNDQILLRRPFSFERKEGFFKKVKGTGTVDASIPVQPGPVVVKVWLSGPDIPSSTFATVSSQVQGGQTRVLRLDYSSGRLSARIQ